MLGTQFLNPKLTHFVISKILARSTAHSVSRLHFSSKPAGLPMNHAGGTFQETWLQQGSWLNFEVPRSQLDTISMTLTGKRRSTRDFVTKSSGPGSRTLWRLGSHF